MTLTTTAKVGAIMGKEFTADSNPTLVQVSGTIIPFADIVVNSENISGASTDQKDVLSAFLTAHIIASSKDVDFRSADVNISISRIPTRYLTFYNSLKQLTTSSNWITVND